VTTLIAVIPVYNQSAELGATLDALDVAICESGLDAEIVVVDDGSTDDTAKTARAHSGPVPVRVVEQENAGRFAARKSGLMSSAADYCLLIDSRVAIASDALAFVESQLPERRVWNAHVEIETEHNPFGVFWEVITSRAFWTYFGDPRTTSFGLEDFERFPKGTTCFFAPRDLLDEAFAAFRTAYADVRNANDDTPIIRWIAAREPINISPRFSCRYQSRGRLAPFLRHAFHRGIVFVDGHGRRESRFFPFVMAFFPSTIAWIVLSAVVPEVVLAPFVLAAAAGAILAVSVRRQGAAATMAWVTPLWLAAYGAGMWKGLGLALRSRLTRALA
jgi:glycosyltransferase involved in cell wall biosynthesis